MDAAILEYIKNNRFISHNDGITPFYTFVLVFYTMFIIFGVIVLLLINLVVYIKIMKK